MTIAIGYVRVSTEEQAGSGLGLEAQEARIRDECQRRGWHLHSIIRDEGVSGKDLNRPGFQKALALLVAGRAENLVVAKLDRISRSVVDVSSLLEWSERARIGLAVLDVNLDTTSPTGRLMAHLLAAVAEWEREAIGTRTRDALAAKRRRGEPISRPSVIDRPDLAQRITLMRADGKSLQAIADILNAEGVPTARGGALWRHSSVQAITGYRRPRPLRKGAGGILPEVNRRKRAQATPSGMPTVTTPHPPVPEWASA